MIDSDAAAALDREPTVKLLLLKLKCWQASTERGFTPCQDIETFDKLLVFRQTIDVHIWSSSGVRRRDEISLDFISKFTHSSGKDTGVYNFIKYTQ